MGGIVPILPIWSRRRQTGIAVVVVLEDVHAVADPPRQSSVTGTDLVSTDATRGHLADPFVTRGLR